MDRASLKLPVVSDASPWVHQADENANRAFFPQMIRIAKEIGIDPRHERHGGRHRLAGAGHGLL